MNTYRIRFYGRFVFTKPRLGGAVKALALDPQSVAGLAADEHRLLLSVARQSTRARSTAPAIFAVIPAVNLPPHLAEQVIWSLEGFDVKFPDGQSATMSPSTETLPNLSTLTGASGRLDRSFSKSKALVEIPSGEVSAIRMGRPWPHDYVPLRAPTGVGEYGTDDLPDMVEVTLKLTGELEIELSKRTATPPLVQKIVVGPAKDADAGDPIVSISHMCAKGSHLGYDREFAALYEALENAPPLNDRLVPRPALPFSETPCLSPAFIEF